VAIFGAGVFGPGASLEEEKRLGMRSGC